MTLNMTNVAELLIFRRRHLLVCHENIPACMPVNPLPLTAMGTACTHNIDNADLLYTACTAQAEYIFLPMIAVYRLYAQST